MLSVPLLPPPQRSDFKHGARPLGYLLEEFYETPFREDDLGVVPVQHACSGGGRWGCEVE